jgi:pyrophosphate--fructose-6-phosphate 1-phosphotransferase
MDEQVRSVKPTEEYMSNDRSVSVEELLNHREIQEIIDDVSQEIRERRSFVPPICDVFFTPYTVLEEDNRYEFEIDKETRKQLPHIIGNKVQRIKGVESGDKADIENIKKNFSKTRTIGIVFSGGPSPGGHNVIAGLYDAAKKANPANKIIGFLMGPDGIIEGDCVTITRELVDKYRNVGGFSMIKTGRTKIDSTEKMTFSRETCKTLGLDAIVVVGGDDSNTNAAFMAQAMYEDGIQVIGVPKTIDGDIQVKDSKGRILCAMSFGFHTAARAYAKNISDLCSDGSSDVKYWHVCKVMGRVASHLALEVALQTHANLTLIGEDMANYIDKEKLEKSKAEGTVDYSAYGMTLRHLSRVICKAIMKRAAVGKNYGVIVIPEGLLEFIDEVQIFIIKLNSIIAEYNEVHDTDFHTAFPLLEDKREYLRRLVRGIREKGSAAIWNARDDELFSDIPEFFQEGLLMERDSHGNFQFSQVKTEKILMQMVLEYLDILKEKGQYKIGIDQAYFRKIMVKAGLDPDIIGPSIFRNYPKDPYCLVKEDIFTQKTLKKALVKDGIMAEEDKVPSAITKIYNKSVPKLKVQTYFYGYDGRGGDPTRFDCMYTYNLGMTVFSLVANGATGQMAAIKNLEKHFSHWEPIGIPIAPLMHLEERGGKMSLVLEKSVVDLESNAFRVVKSMRDTWLAAFPGEDRYRKPGPIRFTGKSEEERPMTLVLNSIRNEEL